MIRTYTMIIMTVFGLMVLGPMAASAKPHCPASQGQIPGFQLDDTQKEAFEASQSEHVKAMIRLRAEVAVAKIDKQNLLKNKDFKPADVKKQITKIMDLKTEMELARLKNMEEIRSILNDEQWAVFVDHLDWSDKKPGKHCMKGKRAGDCPLGKGTMMHGDAAVKAGGECPYAKKAAGTGKE